MSTVTVVVRNTSESATHPVRVAGLHGDREPRLPALWGWLYAVLAVSVGLIVAGHRLAAAMGQSPIMQCFVILAILGLLHAWVRASRVAAPRDKTGTDASSHLPFSVIRVPFPPKSTGTYRRIPIAPTEVNRQPATILAPTRMS